jgi:hypothetical protein
MGIFLQLVLCKAPEVLTNENRHGHYLHRSTILNRPPIQWVPGAFSPGVKRPGREGDHSPSWQQHIDLIVSRLTSACYAIRSIKYIVTFSTLKQIYFGHIIFCVRI